MKPTKQHTATIDEEHRLLICDCGKTSQLNRVKKESKEVRTSFRYNSVPDWKEFRRCPQCKSWYSRN